MDNFFNEIDNFFRSNKSPKKLKLEKNYEEVVDLIYDIFCSMETVTPQLPKRFILVKDEEDTIYVYDSLKNVACSENNIQAALFEAKEAVKFKKLFQERMNKIENQLGKMNNTSRISDNLSNLNQEIKILKSNQIKDISSIKEGIQYLLNYQNRQEDIPDYTTDLCNLLEKLDNLEKKINNVDNAIDRNKNLIRDIRDNNDDNSAYKEDMKRKVKKILEQYALLKDEITKLNVAKQEPESQEDKKEELHIINPDRELLKDMYETSQKINEMIYQTAIALSENKNESLQEDVNFQNQQNNEDSKDEDIIENEGKNINTQEQSKESFKKFEDEIKQNDF